MKYFVLFGERIKPTSCKNLQACFNSPCRNSAYSRRWASLHCNQNRVFPNPSSLTMCYYRGQESGSLQKFRVYSEICFCAVLYISHVMKSLVFCCKISAICISLGQNACWCYFHFKISQAFLKTHLRNKTQIHRPRLISGLEIEHKPACS
jgi:hypothetical protein